MTVAEGATFLGDADADGAPDGDLDGAVTPEESAAFADAPASGVGATEGATLPSTGGPSPPVAGLGALLAAAGGLLRRVLLRG